MLQVNYVYVVVRRDLTPAQCAVQACHAVLEIGRSFVPKEHPHLVLCGVRDESALAKSLKRIQDAGISCEAFREPDIGNALTAFATEPVSGDARRHFKSFKLLDPEPVRLNLFSRLAEAFTKFFSRRGDNMSLTTTATATTTAVFESRWGFHPCDHDTFLKLKFIKKCYFQTLHDKAVWERWERKHPDNRVIRKWHRDADGRKIGCEIVGPRPEPKYCPYRLGSFFDDCEHARMPLNKEDVRPLRHSVDKINQQYYQVKGWFDENR